MKKTKSNNKFAEWSYADIKQARAIAFSFLGMAWSPLVSNTDLCLRLGLTADVFRPQRLIEWAAENIYADELLVNGV